MQALRPGRGRQARGADRKAAGQRRAEKDGGRTPAGPIPGYHASHLTFPLMTRMLGKHRAP
jgi:hypothetical protein